MKTPFYGGDSIKQHFHALQGWLNDISQRQRPASAQGGCFPKQEIYLKRSGQGCFPEMAKNCCSYTTILANYDNGLSLLLSDFEYSHFEGILLLLLGNTPFDFVSVVPSKIVNTG